MFHSATLFQICKTCKTSYSAYNLLQRALIDLLYCTKKNNIFCYTVFVIQFFIPYCTKDTAQYLFKESTISTAGSFVIRIISIRQI